MKPAPPTRRPIIEEKGHEAFAIPRFRGMGWENRTDRSDPTDPSDQSGSKSRSSSWASSGGVASFFLAVLISLFLISCAKEQSPKTPNSEAHSNRVVIQYWEKWTGFEAQAMQDIVDRFNQSQDGITVQYLSTSSIDQKLLLAAAGGNPPDVAGLWANRLYTFAEMGALIPLDRLLTRDRIPRERYLPSTLDLCEYRGYLWGLPTTPASIALHYNTKLFREAGLDPDRPPQTIAELDEYSRRLTKRDDQGNLTQLGYLPTEPGWWNSRYGYWFGGELVDGSRLTADSPENIAAYEWVQSYPKTYGWEVLTRFQSMSGGQFASSQSLFISGKLAMVMQGVWMANFITKHNPQLEWAAAPFPAVRKELSGTTLIECDVLVIPKGCRHLEEAWKFIQFVQRQENLESLCGRHGKFTPLSETSDTFYQNHANPYIRMFRELAKSGHVHFSPKIPKFPEYEDEIGNAFDRIWRMQKTPTEALGQVVKRMQPKFDRARERWNQVADARRKEWSQQ